MTVGADFSILPAMATRFPLTLLSLPVLLAGAALTVRAHEGDPPLASQPELKPLTERVRSGSGDFLFENVPGWGELDGQSPIGPTHGGVAVDKAGLVYTSTDSADGIRVFGKDGKQVRTIAQKFAGTHSLMLREEDGVEYLYGAHLRGNQIIKIKTDGTEVLTIPWPEKSLGVDGKPIYTKAAEYKITGVTVGPDGSIYGADGYGKQYVHKFDAKGNYVKSFGGPGTEPGKFKACHGIGLDTRGATPVLLICDRENRRLQQFDLDGNFQSVVTTDLRRPCTISFHGDVAAIAELEARVAIIDKSNKVVAVVGDNPDRKEWASNPVPRENWHAAIFTAPHGCAWGANGDLYVQDWNKTGRLTKMERVKP